MSILFDALQKVAENTASGVQTCSGEYGVIVTVDPISIRLSNDTVIPSQFITVCEYLTDHDFSFEFVQDAASEEKNEITQIKETSGFYVMEEGGKNPLLVGDATPEEPEESEPPEESGEPEETQGGVFKDFIGKGTIKIKNKLKVNDRVLLLRFASGQNYVVIDRLESIT